MTEPGAGFASVRRYQLGIPTWRALVGLTEIELEAVQHVARHDRTAVFLDARSAEEFAAGTVPGARSIPQGRFSPARTSARCARRRMTLAEAIVREAFHNVAYFPGPFDRLRTAVK